MVEQAARVGISTQGCTVLRPLSETRAPAGRTWSVHPTCTRGPGAAGAKAERIVGAETGIACGLHWEVYTKQISFIDNIDSIRLL